MIQDFPRQLLDDTWFLASKKHLLQTFEEFTPRSAYLSDRKDLARINKLSLAAEEQPNIVSYQTRFCPDKIPGIESFDVIFADNPGYDLIKQKLKAVENYVSQYIDQAQSTFLTFSTDVSGAKIGVKHLHPLMNGQSCNVWSFCIPLYINDDHLDQNPQFWITSQEELFPARWYLDYDRIKKKNFRYGNFSVPLDDKIFSLRFDGSRSPHYIDYKPHVFVWFVFDGVTYKDSRHCPVSTQCISQLI